MLKRTSYFEVTPEGRVLYASLQKPSVRFVRSGEYYVGLLMSPATAEPLIQKLQKIGEEYAASLGRDLPWVFLPYRRFEDPQEGTPMHYLFHFKLNAILDPKLHLSPEKPPIFDAQGYPLDTDVWEGAVIRVSFVAHPWCKRSSYGMTLVVHAVQLLSKEKLDQSASTDCRKWGFTPEGEAHLGSSPSNANSRRWHW